MKLPKLLLFFAIFAGFCEFSFAAEQAIRKGDVVVAPLSGGVSDAQTAFLRRTLKQAESAEASAFVIEMNTPGGALDAAVDILQLLLKARVPTYTWVNTNAGSAGALIALGTDHVYMAPVSAIGAAAPVSSDGADIGETMKGKMVSYFSGYFRSAAQAKGRNPALAEAFINKDQGFKIGNEVICPVGSLLTLSAQEAIRKIDGKPLLADGIAASLDQLKSDAKLTGATVQLEPSGFEQVAQWITLLAPFFLVAGIGAAYMEFKAPGFGVAGFISLLCFATFFFGHYVAGLTGFEAMALFAVGAVLVVTELFFFPGVVVVAALGVGLMFGALLFAMVDYFPGDPWVPTAEMLQRPAINLSLAIVLSAIVIGVLARFFPSLPLFRRIMLEPAFSPGPALGANVLSPSVRLGESGVALTILRPAGRAEFDGRFVDVIANGDFLEAGSTVRVVEISGGRVVVEGPHADNAKSE